ncbi:MAG: SPOR domain-containing protein [Burkholderiales bacterium]|nr:SPOR domain-containing protein [Burkholderiales bacterium]
MDTAAPVTDDASRTTLDASEASATSALYRAAIGPINTDLYQRIFERFEAADRSSPHWNWAAALITLNWMAFRGLWGAALAYMGAVAAAVLLLFGIGRLVYSLSTEVLWALSALLLLLSIVIPGLWGNAMLHAASRKRMAQALSANHTVPQACAMLLRDANYRNRLVWIALADAGFVAVVLGFALNLPTAHLPPAKVSEASGIVQGPVAPPASAPASDPASAPGSAPAVSAASAPAAMPSAPVLAAPELPATSPDPVPVPEKRVEKAPAKAKPTPAAPAARPAPSTQKFFANAGLFANENNAKNVHGKLVEAGMAAFTQEVTGPRGTFTRVRVGPFKTREDAVAAVLKIRSLGLDAEIVNPP